jgi:hypothetical protein
MNPPGIVVACNTTPCPLTSGLLAHVKYGETDVLTVSVGDRAVAGRVSTEVGFVMPPDESDVTGKTG